MVSQKLSEWKLLLAGYFHPRVLAVFFLGISSGLPLALVLSTLSVWLAEEQISRSTIGLFAVVTTPYALKFIWSPLIDQLPLPFFTKRFGRRRGWMIFTQLVLIAAIAGLGATSPAENALYTAIFAFFVATASASQDIVIDAYRVELLEEDQQGYGASMIVFGYRIGMLISGAGALFIASAVSWSATYAIMAACILVGMATVLLFGEPKKSTGFTKSSGVANWLKHAVFDPFLNFVKTPLWWLVLLFIVLYKFGDAFAGVMTNPFLIEIGFDKTEIAQVVKVFGLAASLLGAFAGGILVKKYSIYKSLIICGVLQMLSNLMFVWQNYAGYDLQVLSAVIAVENLSGGMGTTAFVAYISSLCNVRYTATQYALFSSLAAVGRTWLSASSGYTVDFVGWNSFFIISTLIAIPGIAITIYLYNRHSGEDNFSQQEDEQPLTSQS